MLEVKQVYKTYRKSGFFSRKRQQILSDVTIEMRKGECLGIVGESGSGKSTLGRIILGIEKPDGGEVLYFGKKVNDRKVRLGHISAVFQDYTSSFNPHFTVYEVICEPIMLQAKNRREDMEVKVVDLLYRVGLDESYLKKYSHELSGGEAQRVCIARAISTNPDFLLLDEAVSSLDVSVQTQILKLLSQLKNEMNISYLFITHDIQSVTYLCDRVIFFNEGRVVEQVNIENLSQVQNDYSKRLLSAVIAF
ncbi:ABC transporter ATP-binding protein [Clostridium formicaceticum]|uniref:Oligopeptide transport ATP-binding protein OppF n=1 Tax=Clostridium formicaceticum TaxID=1497 RepID=A0AAC9WHG4_9CLOT|nr:dipeptide/oligopeptide/nickel ABC transporter ATP-binding protein [Clostridium formicaceticum]AOY74585.1 peptide ABC transporter ATP-binding protein [Clostridium formicaceticum]ARE88948.1 Oligopeptide transport ATP-binding protein OppF [Clostridium formicaceticum]